MLISAGDSISSHAKHAVGVRTVNLMPYLDALLQLWMLFREVRMAGSVLEGS